MTTTSEARRNAARLVALALVALASGPLHAQANWPNRTIRIIAPVQPGGGVDLVARTVAEQLGSSLGQSVVVENQSGGGGIVGSNATARAAPDGYTLMVGYVGTHGTNPAVRKLPYDAIKDFTPVAMVGGTPNVFVVPPGVPAATLREFVAYAKANPDKLAYGSAGPGTLTHLAMEQFKVAAGVTDITHLAYRGIGPAFTDILGGRTQAMLPGLAAALPHIKAGKVKAIAVTDTQRVPALPNVPTTAEAGYPQVNTGVWMGLFVPAKTPKSVIDAVHAETIAVLSAPDVRKALNDRSINPVGNSSEAFRNEIAAETAKKRELAARIGIKAE